MTRMGTVLLAVLVLMLTCFLVIGAGSSEVRAQPGMKKIMIWVDENDGSIKKFQLLGAGNEPPQDPTPLFPPFPRTELKATISFYEKNPNCIVLVIGGYSYEVCW